MLLNLTKIKGLVRTSCFCCAGLNSYFGASAHSRRSPIAKANENLSMLESLLSRQYFPWGRGKKLNRVGKGVPDIYVVFRFGAKLTILGATNFRVPRSFNLKVSAGVSPQRQYGEYSLKINKVKKMKMAPGS